MNHEHSHLANIKRTDLFANYSSSKRLLKESFPLEDPLPSIQSLAKDLHISVITTKRAYEELEKEGFIESMVGRGSFVAGQNQEWLMEQKLRQIEQYLVLATEGAKSINMTSEELIDMVRVLYEEES